MYVSRWSSTNKTFDLLTKVNNLSNSNIDVIVQKIKDKKKNFDDIIFKVIYNLYKNEYINADSIKLYSKYDSIYSKKRDSISDKIEVEIKLLALILNEIGKETGIDGLKTITEKIATPSISKQNINTIDTIAFYINKLLKDNKEYIFDYYGINIDEIKNDYLKSFESFKGKWIKTPSLVVSWDSKDSSFSIGGHDLYSKIQKIEIDNSLEAGICKIVGSGNDKILKISRSDINSIHDLELLKSIDKAEPYKNIPLPSINRSFLKSRKEVISSYNYLENSKIKNYTEERGFKPEHTVVTRETINKNKISSPLEIRNQIRDIAEKEVVSKGNIVFLKLENFSDDKVDAMIISNNFSYKTDDFPVIIKKLKISDDLKISSSTYNLSKSEIIQDENSVIVLIPKKLGNQNFDNRARISIIDLNKNKVKDIVSSIKKLFEKGRTEEIDIYREIERDMKRLNIGKDKIKLNTIDKVIGILYIRNVSNEKYT